LLLQYRRISAIISVIRKEIMGFGQVTPTARRLIKERGSTCEVEGCYNLATEVHHVFYGRRRGKRHPVSELDVDENFMLVCHSCHSTTGKALSYENRVAFWEKQCERYGHEHMVKWHESLPIKVKHGYLE